MNVAQPQKLKRSATDSPFPNREPKRPKPHLQQQPAPGTSLGAESQLSRLTRSITSDGHNPQQRLPPVTFANRQILPINTTKDAGACGVVNGSQSTGILPKNLSSPPRDMNAHSKREETLMEMERIGFEIWLREIEAMEDEIAEIKASLEGH